MQAELIVFRPQNPAARPQLPPETAGGGNRWRWIFRGAALALAVILLGAHVAPATCAAKATRWLGVSASGIPADCCCGADRPAGTSGDNLSDDSKGCCCPPGGPCSVTPVPGGPEAVPPEGAARAGASESPGRDVDQDLGAPSQNRGTRARCQAGDGLLFLRIGVLRI